MGRRRVPGLVRRRGVWHIDKRIEGQRVCQSTGSSELGEAQRFLARLSECLRQAKIYGVRPERSFALENLSAPLLIAHVYPPPASLTKKPNSGLAMTLIQGAGVVSPGARYI